MAKTRSELRSHVAFNLGNRTDMTARINDYLDWTLEDIAESRNWRALRRFDDSIRTAAGQVHYPAPDRLKDVLSCQYLDGNTCHYLTYVEPTLFHKLYPHPDLDGAGTPDQYTWQGDHLLLYPLPASVGALVELYCVFWPEPFETDSDVCDIPRMDKALVFGATAYAYEAIRELDKTIYWRNQFTKAMIRAALTDGEPTDWTPIYSGVHLDRNPGDSYSIPNLASGDGAFTATSIT